MKILLVNPDDSLDTGPWTNTRWDLAIDLGWSGRYDYTQKSDRMGFRVVSIYDLLDHQDHHRRLRELLAFGWDRLVDSESVDWWEAFSVFHQAQIERLMLVTAVYEQFPAGAEIFATSPHFAVHALTILLKHQIKTFGSQPSTALQPSASRYLNAALTLRPAQLAEIAFDKWDPDYRLRRLFAPPLTRASSPTVLLPSSYVNVTRAQMAYAQMLPQRRFLSVVTRRNGRVPNLPANVEVRSLASYAPPSIPETAADGERLLRCWEDLRTNCFSANRILALANTLHVFDGFSAFLKRGLRIRDAWREVFRTEPIDAVLSADENNPYTRLPIVIAKSRHIHTVLCDHGALNMSLGIGRPVSDVYLVRGNMALDYSVNRCGMAPEKIVVGSPEEPDHRRSLPPPQETTSKEKDWIVFYSEAYELLSARTQVFYSELLPELCALAKRTDRKVLLKLHPFESSRARTVLIDKALSGEQRALLEIREGPMTPDLFERAWCSLTVESSVAVESTSKGVPCFLCGWFDSSWYDYGKQYAKFSAGYTLDSPARIREIPELVDRFQITDKTRRNLSSPISAEEFEVVLSGKKVRAGSAASRPSFGSD